MSTLPDVPRPFSVPQLAHRWGCSEGLVRKMIREGRLHCFRPGTLIRISAAEVERFECQQQQMMTHSASNASEVGSQSCGEKAESDGAASSNRRIARAPRRKPAPSGKQETVLRGPWAGA